MAKEQSAAAAPKKFANMSAVQKLAFLAKFVNPLWERFLAPTSERGAA